MRKKKTLVQQSDVVTLGIDQISTVKNFQTAQHKKLKRYCRA